MNPDQNKNIIDRITKIEKDLFDLNQEVYLNNFTGHQDFNKKVFFNSVLKVPHYSSLPTVAEVGEIVEVSGKLYICSTANNWSLVGTQT